jgi:hypothetical protein
MNLISFPPDRQRGLVLQTTLLLAFAAITTVGIWRASLSSINLTLVIFILLAAVAFVPLPFLAYWLYALARANYRLDRDQLILSWGLRIEQIPISDIEWVRPATTMGKSLRLPFLALPGAILGIRRHADLGAIEFLASEVKSLLLVATAKQVFAISPEDVSGFMESVQHAIEMGSLTPASPQSVYPSFVVVQAWQSPLVRYLWLAGIFLNLGLLVWVSLMIPNLRQVPLGFLASGQPSPPVPGVGLILLPAISIGLFMLGWAAGLFFYRNRDRRVLAEIVWGGGVVSAFLFLLAVMFAITTPV